jgi:2-iminobutanoate/2-iminopropanoate deaminase
MLKRLNPKTVCPPFSKYSQLVEAAPGMRWVHIAGQVGVGPDGKLADSAEGQIEQAFKNVIALMEAAGMTLQDVVKLTTFITSAEHLPALRRVRERLLTGAEPASTLLIVAGLAQPQWIVEVEAIAAKAA